MSKKDDLKKVSQLFDESQELAYRMDHWLAGQKVPAGRATLAALMVAIVEFKTRKVDLEAGVEVFRDLWDQIVEGRQ